MLKCQIIKRKLYDYVAGELSESERLRTENHLKECKSCSRKLSQIRTIIEVSQQQEVSPSAEFWHDFSTGLDRKLNKRLVPKFGSRISTKPVPVFAYAALLVFILIGGFYIYRTQVGPKLSYEDEALIEEVVTMEQLGESFAYNGDALIEEINLLYQI